MQVRKLKGHNGLTLAADVGGDPADPAVVLLHGAGRTRHTWARTARDLVSAGRYVISYDLRGHGDSDWAPEHDYSLDAHLADLNAVIAGLGIKPTLIGSLAGGLIALAMAGEMNERNQSVAALVLVDAVPRISNEVRRRVATFMMSTPEGFETLEDAAEALATHTPEAKRLRHVANLRRSLRLQGDGRWHWHHDPAVFDDANLKRLSQRDTERLEHAARRTSVPTLSIRSPSSGVLLGDADRYLQQLIPHVECVETSASGPGVAFEAEEAFDAAIVSFLERAARRLSDRPARAGVDPLVLRQALGCFGTGVAVITTITDTGEPVGLTANSFTSVSLDPPLILFCLDRKASSFPAFEAAKVYGVNILHIGQQDISVRFAKKGADRFTQTPWEIWDKGAPIVQDSFASFECEQFQILDGGDHRIFIAKVHRVRFDPTRDPLLFLQGAYRRIHVST